VLDARRKCGRRPATVEDGYGSTAADQPVDEVLPDEHRSPEHERADTGE
jgi:hypothetical protein